MTALARLLYIPRMRASALALCILAGMAMDAHAESGRFYAGVGLSADFQDVRYQKSVHTANSKRGPYGASDDETAYGFGVLAGYRWPLGNGLYLSGELDVARHSEKLHGNLQGTGQLYGQVWPENWSFEKDYSYGLTLKLGGTFDGSDIELYALAGVRNIRAEFAITETGCAVPNQTDLAQCAQDPGLVTGTVKRDRDYTAWILGAGIEKPLTEAVALQMEVRYADYRRESWDRLFKDDMTTATIPTRVSGNETSVALRLIRYF